MSRVDARLKNASAFQLMFSQSLAGRRQRLPSDEALDDPALGQDHKPANAFLAIRTVMLGALMEQSEGGERSFDALFAMRQAETIVNALKTCGYEIGKISG
jgi:hypothetical protein